jgi:hypothetical protein
MINRCLPRCVGVPYSARHPEGPSRSSTTMTNFPRCVQVNHDRAGIGGRRERQGATAGAAEEPSPQSMRFIGVPLRGENLCYRHTSPIAGLHARKLCGVSSSGFVAGPSNSSRWDRTALLKCTVGDALSGRLSSAGPVLQQWIELDNACVDGGAQTGTMDGAVLRFLPYPP